MPHAKLEVRMESLLPFLQGTCTPYNMPVYPGAQRIIANSLVERKISTNVRTLSDLLRARSLHSLRLIARSSSDRVLTFYSHLNS